MIKGSRFIRATGRAFFWVQAAVCGCFALAAAGKYPVLDTATGKAADFPAAAAASMVILAALLFLYDEFWHHSRRTILFYYGAAIVIIPALCFGGLLYALRRQWPAENELEQFSAVMLLIFLPLTTGAFLALFPLAAALANFLTVSLFSEEREDRLNFFSGLTALSISVLLSLADGWCMPQSGRCRAQVTVETGRDACNTMVRHEMRKKCWQHFSDIAAGAGQCSWIPKELGENELLNSKDHCYTRLAQLHRDPSLCRFVQYAPSSILCGALSTAPADR